MLNTLPIDKTVTEAAADLHAAVEATHFGVVQVHRLKKTILDWIHSGDSFLTHQFDHFQ